MWIYPQGDGVILSEVGVVNSLSGWHTSIIEMVSGTLKFGLWTTTGNINFTSSISTPLNNWYYVGMTYDGSTLTAYVDGVSAGNITLNRLAPYNAGSGLFYLFYLLDSYLCLIIFNFHFEIFVNCCLMISYFMILNFT